MQVVWLGSLIRVYVSFLLTNKHLYSPSYKFMKKDANPGKETRKMMQDVNQAYEVLKDAYLKKMFDKYGEKGTGTSAASDEAAKKVKWAVFAEEGGLTGM